MNLRALVCDDEKHVIIGLPSIKIYNSLPILGEHINPLDCCEICSNEETERQRTETATEWIDENRTTMTVTIKRDADMAVAIDKIGMKPTYYTASSEEIGTWMATSITREALDMGKLLAEITAITDICPLIPTRTIWPKHYKGFTLSDILGHDDDGTDEARTNDINISKWPRRRKTMPIPWGDP